LATHLQLTRLELLIVFEARTFAMKRRYPLKAIPRCRSVVVFAGCLWAATLACTGPAQAQTLTKPGAATPPRTEVQAKQNTPQNTPAKSGVWHHFGEGNNASRAGQSQPGVWQHFGPNPGPPKAVPSERAPRQEFSQARRNNMERQMWALVNQDRLDPETAAETGGRAQPLRWNEDLAAVARAHSRDMIEQGYFDHVDPEGRTVSTRINAARIPCVGDHLKTYKF
jgi:uncharacterized protein YkwD